MAWLYVLGIGTVVVIIIKGLMAQSDPTKAYILKPVAMVDCKHKVRWDVQEDFMNPNEEVKYEPNTKQPYILRKKGYFDKADDKLPLNDYFVVDGNGFRLYLNNIGIISKWSTEMIIEKDDKIVSLKNSLATSDARIIELEHKLEEQFGKLTGYAKDMTQAVFVSQKKPGAKN